MTFIGGYYSTLIAVEPICVKYISKWHWSIRIIFQSVIRLLDGRQHVQGGSKPELFAILTNSTLSLLLIKFTRYPLPHKYMSVTIHDIYIKILRKCILYVDPYPSSIHLYDTPIICVWINHILNMCDTISWLLILLVVMSLYCYHWFAYRCT